MTPQGDDIAIIVQGANVHLGESLPIHARQSIARVASKYFGRLNAASVHFRRDGIVYRCTVTIQMGGLARKSAEASDKNIYAAFNAALERVAKQLRHTKRELREDQPIRIDKDVAIHMRPILAPERRAASLLSMNIEGDRL